MNRMAI